MHRFYIAPARWNPDQLELDASEAHHALDVLRLTAGERVLVFNGEGAEITAEIVDVGRDKVALRKLQAGKSQPLGCRITLGQAIPKGKNMELIVQKATELGVTGIVPLLSERTVVQIDPEDGPKKQEKWRQTVIEAAKQCGQNWIPQVLPPQTPKQFFGGAPKFDLMLIASLQPDALHLKTILAEQPKPPVNVLILIGPEGDFTPAEISLAKSAGCRPITLGPIVLRTETAAIYSLSVLAYELLNRV